MIAISLLGGAVVAAGIAATVRAVTTDGYRAVPTRDDAHVFDLR